MSESNSRVVKFYSGKSVFITGGSGFVGQVLIEKLLYSCSDIHKIYVLIRPKKHLTPVQRIEQLTQTVVFSRLKSEKPELLKKIEPIEGEMTLPNLGISAESQEILNKNVSVVFHVAATIRFDEPLRQALAINVEGTLELLDMSKRFKKLVAFIHVSTAYSNPTRTFIEEKVYPPLVPLEEVYRYIENKEDDEDLRDFLAGHPNTYSFTKSLAEYAVMTQRGDSPVSIVRPSIVTHILAEPVKDWLKNWSGPTPLLYPAAQGIYRCQVGIGSNVADLIPVDYVSNMIIIAATACDRKDLKVYNCCSGPQNPITWDRVIDILTETAVKRGLNEIPRPKLTLYKSPLVMKIFSFFLLTLPCFFVDCWRWCLGKPTKYMKMNRRIRQLEEVLNFGTSRQWDFEDGNVRRLLQSTLPEDLAIFYCDPASIDWDSYIAGYYSGIRKFLLKLDN